MHSMMNRGSTLATFCGCIVFSLAQLAAISTTNATTIFSWGGNYVSSTQTVTLGTSVSNVDFDGDGGFDDRVAGVQFRLNTAWFPTSANYTGPSVFGGVANGVLDASTGSNATQGEIQDNGTTDLLGVPIQRGSANRVYANYVAFKKSQFLNGADSGTVGFNVGSDFQISEINLDTATVDNAGDHVLRWWVQSNGNFYVSNNTTIATTNLNYNSTDFSSFTWTQQTLTEGSFNLMLFSDTSGTVASSSLTDITAIGFSLIRTVPLGNSSGRGFIRISNFEVTAVPEPGTFALAGCGILGMIAFVRRRQQGRSK